MCSSNDNNFSFVCSYFTDPRKSCRSSGVLEAQRVQEEVISHCKQNVEVLSNEMGELKTLLAAITMKYKIAEDARKVMYKRNAILMDDNKFLQQKLKETELHRSIAQEGRTLAERECKDRGETIKRLETALKEIISEGIQDKRKRRTLLLKDRTSSTTDLPILQEATPEAVENEEIGHPPIESPLEEDADEEECPENTEPPKITDHKGHGDAKKISNNPVKDSALRALDRIKHAKLVKLTQELERMKNMNSWKSSELTIKSRELKAKDAELLEAKREIMMLKNKMNQNSLMRLRNNAKKRIENAPHRRISFKPKETGTNLKVAVKNENTAT